MINFLNLGSAPLWWAGLLAGLLALLAWTVAGILDGATLVEVLGGPILAAAWMIALVLIDRWALGGRGTAAAAKATAESGLPKGVPCSKTPAR